MTSLLHLVYSPTFAFGLIEAAQYTPLYSSIGLFRIYLFRIYLVIPIGRGPAPTMEMKVAVILSEAKDLQIRSEAN